MRAGHLVRKVAPMASTLNAKLRKVIITQHLYDENDSADDKMKSLYGIRLTLRNTHASVKKAVENIREVDQEWGLIMNSLENEAEREAEEEKYDEVAVTGYLPVISQAEEVMIAIEAKLEEIREHEQRINSSLALTSSGFTTVFTSASPVMATAAPGVAAGGVQFRVSVRDYLILRRRRRV